jgi:hypothetical protein
VGVEGEVDDGQECVVRDVLLGGQERLDGFGVRQGGGDPGPGQDGEDRFLIGAWADQTLEALADLDPVPERLSASRVVGISGESSEGGVAQQTGRGPRLEAAVALQGTAGLLHHPLVETTGVTLLAKRLARLKVLDRLPGGGQGSRDHRDVRHRRSTVPPRDPVGGLTEADVLGG